MTPHDQIMAAAIAFKKQLLEYLAEFEPNNKERVEEQLDSLVYQCSIMPKYLVS